MEPVNPMLACFRRYECDKGDKHGYHEIYEPHFEPIKDKELNILEIGVYKGASLLAWRDYFSKANFYGIDLFVRESKREIQEKLDDPRIKLMRGDSTTAVIAPLIYQEWPNVKFDIIIDDGLHTPKANMNTFNNLIPFLKEGGQYFIEDIWPLDIMNEEQMGHYWVQRHPDRYNTLDHEMFLAALDRTNKKVERFDRRKKACPDSYIMRIS